jgi:multiple sugar transport system substrate-binding protein
MRQGQLSGKTGRSPWPVVPRRHRGRGLFNALALSLSVGIVACSSDSATSSAQPTPPRFTVVGHRLRVLGEDSASLAAFEKTKTLYEAASGISVEIARRDHAGLLAELRDMTAAPYDLLVVPSRMLGELVEGAYVQPIEGFLGDPSAYDPQLFDFQTDLLPSWWSQLSWHHGRPYGYPLQLRPMSLWYREDLFGDEDESAAFEKQFGRPLAFPRTASELEQVAAFFHRPQEGLYGTVILGRSRSLASEWLTYGAMFGARILDAPTNDLYGDIVVNSPEAVRATEFYLGLLRFSPPDAPRYDEVDAVRAFETRRIALGILPLDLAFPGPQPGHERKVAGIGYTPAPNEPGSAATPVDGDTFLIARQTSREREAFALMQWALSEDAQVAQILNGGLSIRSSTFTDSRVTSLPKQYPSRPFMQILMFRRLVTPSVSMLTPTIAEADRLVDAMLPDLERIVAGAASPRAGLDRIAVRLSGILHGKAKLRYDPR